MKWFKDIHAQYPLILTTLTATVVGACAGITGQIFSSAYINPTTYTSGANTNTVPELRPVKKFLGIEQDFQVAQTLDGIRPSLVTLYTKKTIDAAAPAYGSKDLRGSGVVITADGWIMTALSAVSGLKADQIVIIENGNTHTAEKVVVDAVTQSAFVKIKATNLPVADFGDSSEMRAGQLVIVPYQGSRVVVPVLANTHATSVGEVATSERFSYTWELQSPTADSLIGTSVTNLIGETIGVVINQTATTIEVRPINQLRFAISEALRSPGVTYAGAGISYVDLAHVPLRDSEATKRLKGGALITAVAKGSPAEKAGIKVGDIVVLVNEQPVDATHALSDLLLQLKPTSVASLGIERGDDSLSISVTLGTQAK